MREIRTPLYLLAYLDTEDLLPFVVGVIVDEILLITCCAPSGRFSFNVAAMSRRIFDCQLLYVGQALKNCLHGCTQGGHRLSVIGSWETSRFERSRGSPSKWVC